ncbi:MAG: hypothetical protein P4L46_02205 [Fimbriimonas sp.]|nr:hypothetical protein [Fimbriimonas sp.]
MQKVAVVISSRTEQYLNIAECIRTVLSEFEAYVRVFVVESSDDLWMIQPGDFDGAMICSGILAGNLPTWVVQWATLNADSLVQIPVALLAIHGADVWIDEAGLTKVFADRTGVHVELVGQTAGADAKPKPKPIHQWFLHRRIGSKDRGPELESAHVQTDWNRVKELASGIGMRIATSHVWHVYDLIVAEDQ